MFVAAGLICKFSHALEGGSECDSQYKTPAETRWQLRDAGDVQLSAGVKVEPDTADGEASSFSGIYQRVFSG